MHPPPSPHALELESDPQPAQSPPSPHAHALDTEAVAIADEHQHQPARPVAAQNNLDGAIKIIAFCLASAIGMATLSLQIHTQLPPMFYLLCFSITLASATLLVSKFIDTKHAVAAQILDRVGVFFAATAVFVAINIPFPLWVHSINWTIYAMSLLAIWIGNRF